MPFHARYISYLLFTTVFGVYLSTMSPVVYLGDSGEFTAAAFSLGIPHNSGYPLYSLLGKIFCMVPIGNVAFRLNLMSAFFSALTVLLVYHIIYKFTRNVLCSLSAAAFLAFTPLFWSQTVSAEVYPLHLFFMALMIWLLWQWEECRAFRLAAALRLCDGDQLYKPYADGDAGAPRFVLHYFGRRKGNI
jgi:hypothetical protein